jgi:protein-tyrosine phosphatase
VLRWFKKKDTLPATPLTTDLHSHLLPALDDGVQTFEQAEEIIREFQRLGYTKLITSPHVMSDSYRNTTDGILARLDELRRYLHERGMTIELHSAAEYYLDAQLMHMLENDMPLLTLGKNYLLFETNFLTEPFNMKEFIFLASVKGYRPVLAHPERYMYLLRDEAKLQDYLDRGILFQVNIGSIVGYYSRDVQQAANRLIDKGWVHFLGSDCHHMQHAQLIARAQGMKYFQKALSLPLLNHTL